MAHADDQGGSTGTAALDLVAAVDLGSNSFHMLVARMDGGRLVVVDRMKDRVRLAGGIGPDGAITADAQRRALDSLERFGQRLADMPVGAVRAIGTNSLRRAKNRLGFLLRAHAALGHPIEVVSGREEARLVYLGVAHSVADPVRDARRLVVDIGGGSTEIIIGESMRALAAESLHMGCVSYTLRFFPDGRLHGDAFQRAAIAARLEMEPHKKRFRSLGWERALGSSGTINAVEQVIRASGFGHVIDTRSLKRLRRAMVDAGRVGTLRLPGLAADRAEVFPGGVAILQGILRSLRLISIEATAGTIREGAILDLLGRRRHNDARDATVADLTQRFGVDVLQAARVERTARRMLDAVADDWKLRDPEMAKALAWAARCHEIGLTVGHPSYHKHGGYLLANADLPGFSRQNQTLLSVLVRSHRRKLQPQLFDKLPQRLGRSALRLAVLLRIAVRLHRGRSDRPLPPISLHARRRPETWLSLGFPPNWLAAHPLTAADLEREQEYLQAVDVKLQMDGPPMLGATGRIETGARPAR